MARAFPRPHRDDLRIALCGLLGGVVMWALGLHPRVASDTLVLWHAPWAPLVPLALTVVCEPLRRIRPRVGLLIGTAALVLDTVTLGNVVTVVMYTDLMYAAVLYGSAAAARRIPVITALLTVLGGVVPAALWRDPQGLLIGVGVGVVALAPAGTGWVVRNHRDAAEAARLRAEQTALLAEMDRAQAVTAERARMARELHDMIANHLSAIAIHSTAALSIDDPRTSRDALTVIRENSVEGLTEMRRLIGILRDSSGDREPAAAPTLDSLDALVAGFRTNGLDISLDTGPDADADAGPAQVPAPVELAAYRIVQESLTNALKHAAEGHVRVCLSRRSDSLHVQVTSPYRPGDRPRAPGSGHGLAGMGERAALLGGSFEAGPEDGRWAVHATLPLTEGDPV
ncbi:signal transduction histidine kinase [Streptomyces griseochromogenes]|uniref:histidine kinase n=1 Tax=Streptomyces griseochromogenes TaxID=68214 RepID=A0A1B1ASD7_9ACTN|nr:histidine kinase [Streptomyces griseochromogenes]ANP49471.1 two-component sensor histidine kinase [Streptomyces griseochromogenes]MBP2053094.1 signal transduction histidine kinase [Streptomyces griseochromogenes]